ncbi:MAG: YeeE/YedE family protein [Candidatus Sericytochromatia bacterium]|nr:YeeE/YedE family protein [Candidatus Sericytochromatia bacterium]
MNKIYVSSFISGLIFAVGLGLSGMMSPEKVLGFLNFTGKWDPSLAIVMGGAVVVTFISFPIILKRKFPVFETTFAIPKNNKVDRNLILGAVLFGTGWGIGGLCPGPAIASLGSFNPNILFFVVAMFCGFFIEQKIVSAKNKRNINKQIILDHCIVD